MFSKVRNCKKPKASMLWIKIVTLVDLVIRKTFISEFYNCLQNENKMFQCRKYQVKSFSLRSWIYEICMSKLQTTFQELSFDTYKIPKKLTLIKTNILILSAVTDIHRQVTSFLH